MGNVSIKVLAQPSAAWRFGRSFYPRHLHGPFLFTGPTHGPDPWSPDHSPRRWPLKLSLPGQLELRVHILICKPRRSASNEAGYINLKNEK